jgi:hypothetical protein
MSYTRAFAMTRDVVSHDARGLDHPSVYTLAMRGRATSEDSNLTN